MRVRSISSASDNQVECALRLIIRATWLSISETTMKQAFTFDKFRFLMNCSMHCVWTDRYHSTFYCINRLDSLVNHRVFSEFEGDVIDGNTYVH